MRCGMANGGCWKGEVPRYKGLSAYPVRISAVIKRLSALGGCVLGWAYGYAVN